MFELKKYIESITGNLPISSKKKTDLNDEFEDHLLMLKKEFMENGMSEEEAIYHAQNSFGSTKSISKKLAESFISLRNIPNVLFGLVLPIALYRMGSYIPISSTVILNKLDLLLIAILLSIYISIPIGYFQIILENKLPRLKNILYFSSVLGTLIGILINFILGEVTLTSCLILTVGSVMGSLLGNFLGYITLIAFNNLINMGKNLMKTTK